MADVTGTTGDDTLCGGAGEDQLSGGKGKDTFEFQALSAGEAVLNMTRAWMSRPCRWT